MTEKVVGNFACNAPAGWRWRPSILAYHGGIAQVPQETLCDPARQNENNSRDIGPIFFRAPTDTIADILSNVVGVCIPSTCPPPTVDHYNLDKDLR